MISASIIAIGDELLNGFTIDSNSQWIKEKLQKYRIVLNKSLIIPDSKKSIFKELENCLNQKVNFKKKLLHTIRSGFSFRNIYDHVINSRRVFF